MNLWTRVNCTYSRRVRKAIVAAPRAVGEDGAVPTLQTWLESLVAWLGSQWSGMTLVTLVGALWSLLHYRLQHRKAATEERLAEVARQDSERKGHEAHAAAWRGSAEAHRDEAQARTREKAALEIKLRKMKRKLGAVEQARSAAASEADIFRDAWSESETNVQIFMDGYAAARDLTRRQSLVSFAAAGVFERAKRLNSAQEASLRPLIDRAIEMTAEAFDVEGDRVRELIISEEEPEDEYSAAVTVVYMLEAIWQKTRLHAFEPLGNTLLPARIMGVLSENPDLPFEEVSRIAADVIQNDEASVFKNYPEQLTQSGGSKPEQPLEVIDRAGDGALVE